MRTLLLDSTFFPVKIISWEKAMVFMLLKRAEVVTEYPNKNIRSVSRSFKLPMILRLNRQHYGKLQVPFNRLNIYWRDNYCCQYCNRVEAISKLTLDHVIPQSLGGKTTWDNIVTCCAPCNVKKGNKSLKEANIKLIKKPTRPKWSPQLCLKLKKDDPSEWDQWFNLK